MSVALDLFSLCKGMQAGEISVHVVVDYSFSQSWCCSSHLVAKVGSVFAMGSVVGSSGICCWQQWDLLLQWDLLVAVVGSVVAAVGSVVGMCCWQEYSKTSVLWWGLNSRDSYIPLFIRNIFFAYT